MTPTGPYCRDGPTSQVSPYTYIVLIDFLILQKPSCVHTSHAPKSPRTQILHNYLSCLCCFSLSCKPATNIITRETNSGKERVREAKCQGNNKLSNLLKNPNPIRFRCKHQFCLLAHQESSRLVMIREREESYHLGKVEQSNFCLQKWRVMYVMFPRMFDHQSLFPSAMCIHPHQEIVGN